MWHDRDAGEVVARPDLLGDVVIARKDAGTSYHIAVVVDDSAQSVTDVVRGLDLFPSTHIHRLLQALLGLPVPRYWHHPLVVDVDGARLAKRKFSPSLASLREAGVDPVDLIAGLRRGQLPPGYRLSADHPDT
jgi:glutamyl-Q tRNA(Asp) synthetase